MVKHFTGVELDKSESRTDWTKRPLTQKQLVYASADVDHLFTIYPKLLTELTHAGFLRYAQLETQNMIDKKFTAINPDNLYLNVKMSWRLNAKQLNTLKYLTVWRYQQAQKRDLPIGFVAKDHTLIALAQSAPQSVSAMLNLDGIELLDVRHKGKAMLGVINQANKADSHDYPQPISRLDEYPGYKQIFKKVKAFLVNLSEKYDLTIENMASKKQINQFLMWHFNLNNARSESRPIDLLSSWRQELIATELLAFVNNDYQ
jgi:ribonuclease D